MTINHIEIPDRFVEIASQWYGGQGCMLYAVCSTGGLTTGTIRPRSDDTGCPMSDEEWYYQLWNELSCDVGRARKSAQSNVDNDADYAEDDVESSEFYYEHLNDLETLTDFEDWIDDNILPRLEREYGL